MKTMEKLKELINDNIKYYERAIKKDTHYVRVMNKEFKQKTFWLCLNYQVRIDELHNVLSMIDELEKEARKKQENPQQSTGLKDKNEKEIYVGSTLRYTKHAGYLMDDCLMTVCYDADRACFGYKSSISMFPDHIFSFAEHDELRKDVLDHCEVR